MVNYDILTIGMEVEFMIDDKINSGVVRYKGAINGKPGLWVGIAARSPGI